MDVGLNSVSALFYFNQQRVEFFPSHLIEIEIWMSNQHSIMSGIKGPGLQSETEFGDKALENVPRDVEPFLYGELFPFLISDHWSLGRSVEMLSRTADGPAFDFLDRA